MNHFFLHKDYWKTATPDLIKRHVDRGQNVNARNKNGYTALIMASQRISDPAIITTLIDHGADVHAQTTKYGYTALLLASKYNANPAVITTLIEQGADVNAQSKYGITALMLASDNDNPAIAKTLIDHGAK